MSRSRNLLCSGPASAPDAPPPAPLHHSSPAKHISGERVPTLCECAAPARKSPMLGPESARRGALQVTRCRTRMRSTIEQHRSERETAPGNHRFTRGSQRGRWGMPGTIRWPRRRVKGAPADMGASRTTREPDSQIEGQATSVISAKRALIRRMPSQRAGSPSHRPRLCGVKNPRVS